MTASKPSGPNFYATSQLASASPSLTPILSVFSGSLYQRLTGALTQIFSSTTFSASQIPAASKNLLVKINQVTFAQLANYDYGQRWAVRKQLAKDLLARGKEWAKNHDWRQFALMVCPGIIRDTTLEGGAEKVSVEASLRFVRTCLAEEGLFFKVDISAQLLKTIETSLEIFSAFLDFRPAYSNDLLSESMVRNAASTLLNAIQKRLENLPPHCRCLYLPLGYRAGMSNQGHAIACKLANEQDHLVLTLFNLGNGADSHPILNYTLNQKQRSFAFFPIRIPKALFFGEMGVTAFSQLLRYLVDAPLSGFSYDGNDLYDIFLQFAAFEGTGELLSDFGPYETEYAMQDQISGNCPEMAVRCLIDDILISAAISKGEREKFFLNREFCALISAYHAFEQNPLGHSSARDLLHEGAQSFGATILAMHGKKLLAEEEFIAAQTVVHQIIKAALKTPYAEREAQAISLSMPKVADTNFLISPSFPKIADKSLLTLPHQKQLPVGILGEEEGQLSFEFSHSIL